MHLKCLEQTGPGTSSKKIATTIIVVVIILYQVYISFLHIFQYESSTNYLKNIWKNGAKYKKD